MADYQVNSGNVMRSVYETSSESLRVNIVGSGGPTVPNVVRLTDGTDFITSTVVGSDRALDVHIVDAIELAVSHLDDSIRLGDGTNYLTSTTSGPKTSLDVNVSNLPQATNPLITNTTITLANTEYSFTLTSSTKKFLMKLRNPGKLQFCYTSGQSNSNFITVSQGNYFTVDSLTLSSNLSVFFQSSSPSNVLEIMSWT